MNTDAKPPEALAAENEKLRQQLVELTNTLNAIRPSELRYRRVFEAAHDGVLILNADTGQIEDANPFMTELLGYTHEQFLGRRLWEIGLFKDIEQSKAAFIELQEKGHIRYEDLPLQDTKGIHRQVEFVSNVYEAGEEKAIQCNIRDITERQQSEESRREIEGRYTALVKNIKDHSIFMTDAKGNITSWNDEAKRIIGYTEEEILGRHFSIIFLPEDIKRGMPEQELRTAQEKGRAEDERWHRRKDGSQFWALGIVTPRLDGRGNLEGFSKILRDMTERKLAQEQLLEYANTLQQADRRKNEFLALLAHELRNPLAPIRNGIDVLQILPPGGDQAKQILGMMGEQAGNLVRLIDDLLDVSRITQGKLELKRKRVALTKIIANAIQTAQPLIQANGHEITVTQSREILFVNGDPTRLTQVVSNLLNNAARYTRRGGKILLTTERTGDEVVIMVKDNGTGIAPDMLPNIFDLFVQADSSLNRKHGGLGIGLTLVKRLVEMHGGTIEATSEGLGKGSEFAVRLPILKTGDVVPDEATDLPRERRSFPPHKILIVDDVRPIAFIVATLLRSYGQIVRTASSGVEALSMIEAEKPELIFSDISMPEMTGYELAQQIRRRPDWNDICLVAVTGYGQESDKKLATDAGFNDHVVKPIRKEDLERLLVSLAYLR